MKKHLRQTGIVLFFTILWILSDAQTVQRLRIPAGVYTNLEKIPVYCIDMLSKAPTTGNSYTMASPNIEVDQILNGVITGTTTLYDAINGKRWFTVSGASETEAIAIKINPVNKKYKYVLRVNKTSGIIGPPASQVSGKQLKYQEKIEALDQEFSPVMELLKKQYRALMQDEIKQYRDELMMEWAQIRAALTNSTGFSQPERTKLLSEYNKIWNQLKDPNNLSRQFIDLLESQTQSSIAYITWISESGIFSETVINEMFDKYTELGNFAKQLSSKKQLTKSEIDEFRKRWDVIEYTEKAFPSRKGDAAVKKLPPPEDGAIRFIENGIERPGSYKELEEKLSQLECGLEDICLNWAKKDINAEVKCKMDGESVSFKIGTDKAFDFKLKTKTGATFGISRNEDGEIKVSNSLKQETVLQEGEKKE